MLAGQTNFEAALDLTLPTCGAMGHGVVTRQSKLATQ